MSQDGVYQETLESTKDQVDDVEKEKLPEVGLRPKAGRGQRQNDHAQKLGPVSSVLEQQAEGLRREAVLAGQILCNEPDAVPQALILLLQPLQAVFLPL